MKLNFTNIDLKKFGTKLLLAGGITFAAGVGINAQMPPRPNASAAAADFGGDWNRMAREQGMRDGLTRGTNDRSRNRSFRPEKSGDYKKATAGYLRSYGSRDEYRSTYRQGFLAGYDRGYQGRRDDGAFAGAPPKDRPAPRPRGEKPPPPTGEKPPRPMDDRAPRPMDDRAPRPMDGDAPQPMDDRTLRPMDGDAPAVNGAPAPAAPNRRTPKPRGEKPAPRPNDRPAPPPADGTPAPPPSN